MINFNIIQSDEKVAEQISTFLIKNNYALQTHIDTNKILTSDGEKSTIRLFFITKALLYSSIEKQIIEKFYSKELIIYATPVSHISEAFGEQLRLNIKAV